MKKILVVLLALAMTLTLVACGGGKDDETTKAPEGTKTPAATTAEPTPEATTAEPTPEATTAEPTPEATTAPEAAVTTEEPGKVTEGDTTPEATEPEATPAVTEPEATEPEATEPEATEPEATEPEVTLPEAPEGYTYHTIEGVGFVCPSTWEKTTQSGQTLYADQTTGANIVVVATAKTDRYENLTVEGFRAEVGTAYEQMGATIKSIEYGPATVAGDLAVMRGYVEVELYGTVMTQEMFVVSSETHTYAVNLSFVPMLSTDAAAITEVVANSIVVLH